MPGTGYYDKSGGCNSLPTILERIFMKLCFRFLVLSILITAAFALSVSATSGVEDMWTVANRIIIDVYNHIAGISTVLAALMTTVCVVGMKLSNNQQKVDQSVDWLKRIWISWAIINGIGAFLAYVRPLLDGLATITV